MALHSKPHSAAGSSSIRQKCKNTGFRPFSAASSRQACRPGLLLRSNTPSVEAPEAVVEARPVTIPFNTNFHVAEVAAPSTSGNAVPDALLPLANPTALAVAGGLALGAFGLKKLLDTPSRAYNNNVGTEYDAWTEEGAPTCCMACVSLRFIALPPPLFVKLSKLSFVCLAIDTLD